MIGYAFCGSFCTLSQSFTAMSRLIDMGYDIQPIMSENVYSTDTRFFRAEDFRRMVIEKSGKILCTKLDAGWMDIGNYNSLDSVLEHDQNNNTINENANYVDCNNCMVIGNKENVIIMDVNDLIVSVNDGKILIMKKTSDMLKLRRIK